MKLEKVLLIINSRLSPGALQSHIGGIDARAILLITLLYLVLLLSVPIHNVEKTIWFAAYPIVTAPLAHIPYEKLLVRSFQILPLIVLIGVLNPIFDNSPAFNIGELTISKGWLSFVNIIIRGLLAFQALLLLIHICGFNDLCCALHGIGVPEVLCVQLLMLYRYVGVILEEGGKMRMARMARGYGRRNLSLRLWGSMIGGLLLRSADRATRIYNAMCSRGFNGKLYTWQRKKWDSSDTLYCFVWASVLFLLRFADISGYLGEIVSTS